MLRVGVTTVAVVVVLALVAVTVFSVVVLRRPLPTTDGSLDVAGLESQVTVRRDAQGVPDVYASSDHDLFMAQGYVQAQDRFFEMDYRRHVTAGRLAELVGDVPEAIDADKVTRTLGWRHVAQQEWDLLDDSTKANLQSYAQGVNAYLDGRSMGETAVEYTVLGMQVDLDDPERWDPVDSLAWLKAMAWDLRGNYDDELDRALSYSTLRDVDKVDELFPQYDGVANAPILDGTDVAGASATSARDAGISDDLGTHALTSAVSSAEKALAAIPELVGRGDASGSNSWVVAGEHTASGKPLLANDPHLALGVPSIWAQVGLHCTSVGPDCGYDVSGFSFAGFPGVMIGHNGQLAWGLTNMGADVTDFFVERVQGEDYLRDGKWVPLETRKETIRVAGSDPVTIDVRSTVHGPIVSGALDGTDAAVRAPGSDEQIGDRAVSLRWTALDPGHTADAVFAIDRSSTAHDIRAAAKQFDVPAQNIVFATVDGDIGYQAPGKVPVRRTVAGPVPSDGSWPRPGWDSRYDWQGYVDPDDMPRVVDPAEGFLVAANQAVEPRGRGPFLTNDWDYGYRSQRIRTLLQKEVDAKRPVSVATMQQMQLDDWSPFADALVPTLLKLDIGHGFDADGQKLLASWDYRTDEDSSAAAYFAAVWRNILQLTFWDDVPASMRPSGDSRWLAVVQGLMEKPRDAFWDDRTTLGLVETRDEVLKKAMVTARLELTTELGKRTDDWDWGRLHQLSLKHPVLGGDATPTFVRGIVNPDAVQLPGSPSVVDAIGWDAAEGFAATTGPSMRMVVDLGDLDRSSWVTVTGVSGHPASDHYTDQLEAWANGKTFAWPFGREAVASATDDTLVLEP
ncbi:penicillin amidase [Cellulomonas sp. PhB143]|nr:penicillin amidase [Cellulomonas sp. PhB143]